ncbi:acyltransferase-like protein, chloroplastic [Tanacetum coccineum]
MRGVPKAFGLVVCELPTNLKVVGSSLVGGICEIYCEIGDLVAFVEETLKFEHALYPSRPIYLVGDTFRGCLALAVAAHNPKIDLVVILSNPGDLINMETVTAKSSRVLNLKKLSNNLTELLPRLSGLSDIIPKSTLRMKLKLLKAAAAYANSGLHVKAEVLLLASGKDNMLLSSDEALRLKKNLKNCKICYYKDNGHTLLLEDGINLLTVIKGMTKYRRSWKHDFVKDYFTPSMSEYKSALEGNGSQVGEEYKLFWPDQPEFVRMAAKFGATIVPFGAVREDDLVETLLGFVNLKLYESINLKYPPILDRRLKALAVGMYLLSREKLYVDAKDRPSGTNDEESKHRLAQLQDQLPSNEPGALMNLVVNTSFVPWSNERPLENKELNAIIGA